MNQSFSFTMVALQVALSGGTWQDQKDQVKPTVVITTRDVEQEASRKAGELREARAHSHPAQDHQEVCRRLLILSQD